MSTLKSINTTQNTVMRVLAKYPVTRDNDDLLFLKVACQIRPEVSEMPFRMLIMQRGSLGIPGFETVRRTRQKLQAKYPELRASDRISKLRAEAEDVYREYAREGVKK